MPHDEVLLRWTATFKEKWRKLQDYQQKGIVGPESIERWVTDRGVAPSTWVEVTTGWSARMMRFAEVRRRYDELVSGT